MSLDISNTDDIQNINQEKDLTIDELNQKKTQEFIEKQKQKEFQHIINVLKRQTTYDEETIKEKLIEFDNDPTKVVKHYLGIDVNKKKEEKKITTLNQGIYSEIRTLMDDAASEFRKKQEYTEYVNKVNYLRSQQLKNQQLKNQQLKQTQNKIIEPITEEPMGEEGEEPMGEEGEEPMGEEGEEPITEEPPTN